jgi:protein-tyrosine phosphatase
VGERRVTFTNIFNFRDLGGYPTQDGRVIRWRRLYRSDDLSRLAQADCGRFGALGIRTVVDLRRPAEIVEDGRCPALPALTYRHVFLDHSVWPAGSFADTAERAEYVLERYRELSLEAGDAIGVVLRLIADADAAPLVFHCVAGKDRTGVVAALTLALLGVGDETIAEDYTLSEKAEPHAWAYLTRNSPELIDQRWKHFTVSPRQAMMSFLDDVRARHGSITAYAESIGVTATHVKAMQAHLLDG